MPRRKRLEITVEQDTLYVMRTPPRVLRAWCPGCRAEVDMLTLEEAATLAGCSMRVLVRRAEAGQVHFAETSAGRLLICPHDLLSPPDMNPDPSTNYPDGGTP